MHERTELPEARIANTRRRVASFFTVPLLVLCCNATGACTVDEPALSDAGGDAPPCSPFADRLVVFTPPGGTPSMLGERALGAPDGQIVSLEPGASLTVAFIGLGAIVDQGGADVRVHGDVPVGASTTVSVSGDNDGYTFAHELVNGSLDIDIADASLSAVTYVRAVGVVGVATVDAIESLQTVCNP